MKRVLLDAYLARTRCRGAVGLASLTAPLTGLDWHSPVGLPHIVPEREMRASLGCHARQDRFGIGRRQMTDLVPHAYVCV